jgi:hypothetical protein
VDDEQPAPAGGHVGELVADVDVPEVGEAEVLDELPHELVVVADHPVDLGPAAEEAEDLADDEAGVVVPVPVPLELPAVDEVADDEDLLRRRLLLDSVEELQQGGGVGVTAAEVQVRDEEIPNVHHKYRRMISVTLWTPLTMCRSYRR